MFFLQHLHKNLDIQLKKNALFMFVSMCEKRDEYLIQFMYSMCAIFYQPDIKFRVFREVITMQIRCHTANGR